MSPLSTSPRYASQALITLIAIVLSVWLSSCGGSGSTTTTAATTTNAYALAYQKATWGTGVTVAFPSACSMTVSSSGVPPSHNAYYLAPVMTGGTVVATTPSGIALGVTPYAGSGISIVNKVTATFNICPSKATSTTAASGGAIGVITSGEVLFDAYEATSTVALGDNTSYTFTSGGTSYTAYFVDQCNSHPTGGMGNGSTWHYHGAPVCWTPTVDGASGASHIIGIALDGFPIYGGRDVNGNVIDPSTLDACNGITSVTPEFTTAMYHYVLPIAAAGTAVPTKQSSINCYAGSVSATLSAQMKKIGCNNPVQLANGKMRLPDGREVSPAEAEVWRRSAMPDMQMADSHSSAPSTDMRQSRVPMRGM